MPAFCSNLNERYTGSEVDLLVVRVYWFDYGGDPVRLYSVQQVDPE